MTGLFQVLPSQLFSPLAARGAPVYVEVLMSLLDETQRHHQPLSRELANAIVIKVLSDPSAFALTEEIADDSLIDQGNDRVDQEDHLQLRAGQILRYLIRCGWLRSEVQNDFTQTLILPDYAFRILRVLREIAGNESLPLQGLICSIHDLLQAAVRDGDAHIRLREAHRQTMHLLNGLKELQHNIGAHIEQVLVQYETHAVLERLFLNYRDEIVDSVYHQLRTTDHVSRFRPNVLNALSELSNSDRLDAAAQRLFKSGETSGMDAAVIQLREQLSEIRDHFELLDRLLQSIDLRHSQFVDSAVRKIELQLSASTTTSGQLHAILSHLLSDQAAGEQPNTQDEQFFMVTEPLIKLFRMDLLDQESLAPPSRAGTPFEPEPVPMPVPSPDELEAAQEETLRQLTRAVSRQRIRRFAHQLLCERTELRAAEVPLSSPDDLPLLIYLRTYGDGSLGFRVEEIDEEVWVERSNIGFRDFILRAVALESQETTTDE